MVLSVDVFRRHSYELFLVASAHAVCTLQSVSGLQCGLCVYGCLVATTDPGAVELHIASNMNWQLTYRTAIPTLLLSSNVCM